MSRPGSLHRARSILDQLRDERGRRVVLVSHCLLNQNTRYAGGATRSGAVAEIVDELVGGGFGIHQVPCPEQLAWGGVLKTRVTRIYGARAGILYPVRGVLLPILLWWTRRVYRRLARSVVRDVMVYRRAGIEVSGLVGIGGSPSCGVSTTLDLRESLDRVATCPLASLTQEVMNERVVLACRRPGQGLFVQALDEELRRRRATLGAWEHDLALELSGVGQAVLSEPQRAQLGT